MIDISLELTHMQTQTQIHTDRQTGRQAGRQTDRQTDTHTLGAKQQAKLNLLTLQSKALVL